jgi:hypothetical protein
LFPCYCPTSQGGNTIDQETIHMSMSPTLEARSYQLMYAFGNYILVVSAEEHKPQVIVA